MSGTASQSSPSLFNQYIIAFEGSSVACILYGVYLVTAWVNMSLLQEKRHRVILSFTIAQLVITTLYMGMSLYAAPAQSLGIFDIVDTFGGPDVSSTWPAIFVDCAFVLNTWISDAFLLYRCYVIWMGNKRVFASASVFYVATFGTSLAWLVVSSMPGAAYSTHSVQVAGICYWTCSAAMNIFVSSLIYARLWMHRQAILKVVGPKQGGFFLCYMVMTFESAILCAVFAIIALAVFTTNSPLQNLFFPVLGVIQAMAPALIIYRIARGISFEMDEHETITTGSIHFAPSNRLTPSMRPTRRKTLNCSETTPDGKTNFGGTDSFVLDEIRDDVPW